MKSLHKKKTTDGPVAYADNTFLPLRRLRANTLRPLLVLIRLRNHVHVDDGVSLVGKFSSLIYTSSIPLLNNDTDYFTKSS